MVATPSFRSDKRWRPHSLSPLPHCRHRNAIAALLTLPCTFSLSQDLDKVLKKLRKRYKKMKKAGEAIPPEPELDRTFLGQAVLTASYDGALTSLLASLGLS